MTIAMLSWLAIRRPGEVMWSWRVCGSFSRFGAVCGKEWIISWCDVVASEPIAQCSFARWKQNAALLQSRLDKNFKLVCFMLAQLFQVCSFSPFIFDEIIQKAEPTWNKQFEKLHQWWVWWILRFFNYTALSCLSRRESKARPFTLSCNVLYLVSALLRAEKLDSAKNKERISILGDESKCWCKVKHTTLRITRTVSWH